MKTVKERLIINDNKVFIPLTLGVGNDITKEEFITPAKIGIVLTFVLGTILAVYWAYTSGFKLAFNLVIFAIWFLVWNEVIWRIVFEGPRFQKYYNSIENDGVMTYSDFWGVSDVKSTNQGDILIFKDGKVGILASLERSTIVGQAPVLKDNHRSVLSDFYKLVHERGYRTVKLELMETQLYDVRLDAVQKKLNDGIRSSKLQNKALKELIELQLGHIKNLTREMPSTRECILIYAEGLRHIDRILDDVNLFLSVLTSGGNFKSYELLDLKKVEVINNVCLNMKNGRATVERDKSTETVFTVVEVRYSGSREFGVVDKQGEDKVQGILNIKSLEL